MKILISTIICINIILTISQFYLSSLRASQGEKLAELEKSLINITNTNQQIENQILSLSSLSYIKTQAQHYGLKPIAITPLNPISVAEVKTKP